jgi:5-methylcytosine-specific restriction protein A
MPYSPGQLSFARSGPSRSERERERKRTYDTQRQSSFERGYTGRWRKARLGFLAKHPLCCKCEEQGLIVPATVVDHIDPHRGDKAKFWDRNNWQPMCKPHHDAKTAQEDSAFASPGAGPKL